MHIKLTKFIFINCLILIAPQVSAGLFDKKISSTISYEIIDVDLQPVTTLNTVYKNSLLSLEAGLRGYKNKTIKKSIGVTLVGKDVAAMEASLTNLRVTSVLLDNIPDSNNKSEPLSGYMTFGDEAGRMLQIGFVLLAGINEVTLIGLNPVFYGAPNIELFIVPEDKLNASTVSAEKNYISLYKNISSNSLNPGSFPGGIKKYYIVAFFKSIIPPGVIITLKTDSKKEGLQGDTRNNKFKFFDDSWLVAVREIETDLLSNTIWTKITLKPDPQLHGSRDGEEYVVGLFNVGR